MRWVFFLFASLWFSSTSLAGTELPIALEDDAAAKITVGSCFSSLPPVGYAPIAININNYSDRAQSWTFEFTSPGLAFLATNTVAYSINLGVQANAARTFKVVVPLALRSNNSYFAPLAVKVSGPGASARSMAQFPTGNRSGKPSSAFVAMSEGLAGRSWSQLEKETENHKEQLVGTRFRTEDLPDDWRALSGIAGLWLGTNDLDQLSAAQREALHDWVSRGGALFVCGTPNAPADFGPAGFGQVTAIADPRIQVSSTALLIHSLRGTIESKLANDYSGQWGARKELGEIKANVPLLMVFLMIFGALAGPINLFVFAGHGARHRLFWTTPVISLAASALLFVLIVLKDGFGGSGVRFALVQIMPAAKKSVALQEQISRTGVLRSASFITHDPTLIAPITLDSRTNAPKRKYENVDTKFGGEWFTSRSIQAHWLETIAPTRAEISLLNAAEVRGAGAAPVLVSSMAMPLDQVYFRDDRGGAWQVRNMHTGEKMTLQRIASIPNLLPIESGQRLRDMWDQVKDQTGTFYAVTSDPRALVETLPSIRWKDQRAIYLGPVARASP